MDLSKKSTHVLNYLKRRYSSGSALYSLDEPTFVTHHRRATVFLGGDWKAGRELCRVLKNKGYSVTLRVRHLPCYKIVTSDGTTFSFSKKLHFDKSQSN